MTHVLTRIHKCGHLYVNGGGGGENELDLAPFITSGIAFTRDLPGFVADKGSEFGDSMWGVTYASHHFWVHFERDKHGGDVYIRVHHGGGWELWRGDYMLANALRHFGPNDQALFLLCWHMIDNAVYSRLNGSKETAQEYRQAFAEGRLKKRKQPGREAFKIWIEPMPEKVAA